MKRTGGIKIEKRLGVTSTGVIALLFVCLAAKTACGTEINDSRLRSLPYMSWTDISDEDREKAGVVLYEPSLSYNGANVYNSRFINHAYLMDMGGRILHTWSAPTRGWRLCVMDGEGNLYFITWDGVLEKVDWDSREVWTNELNFHHCVTFAENGDIYTLTMKTDRVTYKGTIVPIINDYITVLDGQGNLKKTLSVYKLLGGLIPVKRMDCILNAVITSPKKLRIRLNTKFDVFHSNKVVLCEKDIEGVCRKGDIVLSVRHLNGIFVIRPDTEEVVWSWGPGEIESQHDPSFLENGNILLFDNGTKRGFSRVIEMDPVKKEIVWEYKADPPEAFFSNGRGGCQKLPNGNVLITDSESGRVFEVTMSGKTVWEFYNPDVKDDKRAIIYRMMRFSPDIMNAAMNGPRAGSRDKESE